MLGHPKLPALLQTFLDVFLDVYIFWMFFLILVGVLFGGGDCGRRSSLSVSVWEGEKRKERGKRLDWRKRPQKV